MLVVVLGRNSVWNSSGSGERATPGFRIQWNVIALIAILLIAFALRIYRLNSGLWHDEILTYVRYVSIPVGESITTFTDKNQHFLFTILSHASIRIFGDTNWALRLPAVLFGVASLWALYLFGCAVTTPREALLATALLTFSYHHVWFSQNARGYTGLLFWTILTSWLFLRGLRESKPRIWLLYAAATALGVYTNMEILFVVATHFLLYLMELYKRKENWPEKWFPMLGFFAAGLLTFQLHALVLPQVIGGVAGEESTVPAWKSPMWTILEFVKALEIGFSGALIALASLAVFAAGLYGFWQTNRVVVYLLIIPSVICGAVAIGMGHHVWPRFFFFAFGFATLVVVRGTMIVGEGLAKLFGSARGVTAGTVLCVLLICVSALSIPYAYSSKQDYEGALVFLEQNKKPDDAIATVGLASFDYKNFYKTGWKEIQTLDDLNVVRSHARRTWLVYTFPTHVRAVYPQIWGSIQSDFKVIRTFSGTVGDGVIFVCRSDIPPS